MEILRPAGYSELLAEYINFVTPHNVIAVAVIDKIIDATTVSKAVTLMTMRHPILNAYIDHSDYIKFVNIQADVRHNNDISYYENPPESLETIIEQHLKLQLTGIQRPLFHVTQIISDNATHILLTLQHTICDGLSILALLMELTEIIDNLISNNTLTYPNKNCLPSLDDLMLGEKVVIHTDLLPSLEKTEVLENNPISKRYTGINSLALRKAQKNTLLRYANQHRTTPMRVILAMLTKLSHKHARTGNTHFDVNIMVDLRKFLNRSITENDIGFYSGYIHIDVDVANKNRDELTQFIHQQIKNSLEEKKYFGFSRAYRTLLESCNTIEDFINHIGVERPAIGISNLGITTPKHHKNFTLKSITPFVSCHAYSRTEDTFFICMNTYLDKMYINFHHPLPVFQREKMQTIIDDFLIEIDRL